MANSPAQSELLAEVRSSVERWINTSATTEMEAKRSGKDISSLVSADTGETLMADIRQMLATFEKSEVSVYEVRASAASHERIVKTSALALLAFLAVALLVISNSYSFVLVRRQLVKLEGVETRIRSIIENILDGMIAVNEEGAICSMNPAAEKMFGCRDNEMVGHSP